MPTEIFTLNQFAKYTEAKVTKLGMDSMPDLTKALHHEHDKVKARMLLPETTQDELAMLLAEHITQGLQSSTHGVQMSAGTMPMLETHMAKHH